MPGLSVRIRPDGSRTFYFSRRVNGKFGRLTLGTLDHLGSVDAARAVARTHNATIAANGNPFANKAAARAAARHTGPTLGDLWADFLRNHAELRCRPRTIAGYRQCWGYLTRWENRELAEITESEVDALKSRIGRESGQYQANRVMALLSAMYRKRDRFLGLGRGVNPAARDAVERFPEKERQRVLSPEEMTAFWRELNAEPDPTVRAVFRMLLYTGARKSNVLNMRWEHVNLERGEWAIPGETTKNGQPSRVPLVPEAVALLRKLPDNSPYVFAGSGMTTAQVTAIRAALADGQSTRAAARVAGVSQTAAMRCRKNPDLQGEDPKPINCIHKALERICQRASIRDMGVHDLRRSFVTFQIRAGASLPVVAASVGHKSMQTTPKHYALALAPCCPNPGKAVSKRCR